MEKFRKLTLQFMKAYKHLMHVAPNQRLRTILGSGCEFVKFSTTLEYYTEWTKIGNTKLCDASHFEASNGAVSAGLKVQMPCTH